MTEETENLVLELLRGMRADIAAIRDEQRAMRERLERIESSMALRSHLLGLSDTVSHMDTIFAVSSTRIEERLGAIETRLEERA